MRSCEQTRDLLQAYRSASGPESLTPTHWTGILGAARRSRTLGHLGLAKRIGDGLEGLADRVRLHFESIDRLIAYRRARLRWELKELSRATPRDTPIVLVKGAAYEALDLPLASARLAADIDLLVDRPHLPKVEQALRTAGWIPAELNDYDERYYREWSHELPPFKHPARGIECDLHHSITPAMRGQGVDTAKLIEKSIEVEWDGHRRFRVLQPVDQLIHCALHTFKDSDLTLRLRESMDFDLLYRHYAAADATLPEQLAARALELGQARPVWWAVHFARRWLGSPIPESVLQALPALPAPSPATVRVMEWLCDRAMLPGPRLERTGLDRIAAMALLTRYQYQRLPLSKLIPHVLEKSRRRLLLPKDAPEER